MKAIRPDLMAIRGWFGCVHLLVDDDGLVLVDAGFAGDCRRLQNAVLALGRKPGELKAILITHGHLDHVANAARLQAWSGAKVYAPAGDEDRLEVRYSPHGVEHVCGWLEAAGRGFMQYRAPRVDVWMRDGDELPVWGGLRVIGLPGHTAGHVGFYSPSKRVFFVGDAFAVSWRIALPPGIFNADTTEMRLSFQKAAAIDADLFVPNHYFGLGKDTVQRVRARAAVLETSR